MIKGDGTALRSYLYADDLVRWLFTIYDSAEDKAVFNVGSEEAVSIAGLAEAVARHFSPAPQVKILSAPVPGALPQPYVPSTEKIRRTLGVAMTRDLDQSIAGMIAFHRQNSSLQ